MTHDRRAFLGGTAMLTATALLPVPVRAQTTAAAALFAPQPGPWRTWEITTAVRIPAAASADVQAWIPVPAFTADAWMRPGATTWKLERGRAELVRDQKSGASMVHARWAGGEPAVIEVTSRFSGRDRNVAPTDGKAPPLGAAERALYTSATDLLRLDGIVKETSDRITAGASGDADKARRIYDWIVDNTFRDPKTRGCGIGDVEGMLKTGNLSGKCADLNALFVGLARAAGLPARDIYGIRVGPSAFGYRSLGTGSATITRAQHCRAEVHLEGVGWLPADPADVRKVVLEEPPGNLALDDAKVVAARRALLGAWETNWLAYNDAHDVALPGSSGPPVSFLMYPQAETSAGRLDPLEPDAFAYAITSRQVEA